MHKTTHAGLYSKYKPNYPKSLVKLLLGYLQQNGGAQDLAVDVGCGSGQGMHLPAAGALQAVPGD